MIISLNVCRENFGYISPNWRDLPSTDPKFVRKRTAVVQATLQCGQLNSSVEYVIHSLCSFSLLHGSHCSVIAVVIDSFALIISVDVIVSTSYLV